MKNKLLYLINHPIYGIVITILTNLAGVAFLWTSINAWFMSAEELLGFKTQIITWIMGAISNFVLVLVLYATNANRLSIATIMIWCVAMLNMTIVVMVR